MTYLLDEDSAEAPPRVAYAIGKAVGSAVTRNRLRRRIRAVLSGLAGTGEGGLPPGAYLVRTGPGSERLSSRELEVAMAEIADAVGVDR